MNENNENVKMTVSGNKLTIEIDLSHRGEISKTGKSKRVATTFGNKKIEGFENVKIGINAFEVIKWIIQEPVKIAD